MGLTMDIAQLSMDISYMKVAQQVQLSVIKNALDTQIENMEAIVETMSDNSAYIDIKV